MLKVLDNGVKIQLENKFSLPVKMALLSLVLIISVFLGIVGILFFVKLITSSVATLLITVIIVGFFGWQVWQKNKNQTTPTLITGGEVTITPAQIEHTSATGQKMVYPLPKNIHFESAENNLKIIDNANLPLITIQGFSSPQHITIAQAVLQGKTIKTQGKAIKMQSN